MESLPKEERVILVQDIRLSWRKRLESQTFQIRVAEAIGDKQMGEAVRAEAARCLQAIDECDKILTELNGG